MQYNAIQYGKLIDNGAKFIIGQVAIFLSGEKGTWALLAKFVTTAGWLDVD